MKFISPILALFLLFAFSTLTFRALNLTTPSHVAAEMMSTPPAPSLIPEPKLSYNQNLGLLIADPSSAAVDAYNNRLNQVYRTPLTISIKEGASLSPIELPSSFLRALLIPPTTSLDKPLQIDKDMLLNFFNETLTKKQKEYYNPDALYQNVITAVNTRFYSNETPVVLGVDDGPTSGGELAGRYLEVDLSQQKMYFFINHELYKTYHVSTGLDYPTPVGDYSIQNKTPLAFSDIYNVWMRYWMGFTYINKLGASLGLHEIAYTSQDKKGKPIYSSGYYIGDKGTGGCVAMEPKDSKEIYDLSPVGMLVRIVP